MSLNPRPRPQGLHHPHQGWKKKHACAGDSRSSSLPAACGAVDRTAVPGRSLSISPAVATFARSRMAASATTDLHVMGNPPVVEVRCRAAVGRPPLLDANTSPTEQLAGTIWAGFLPLLTPARRTAGRTRIPRTSGATGRRLTARPVAHRRL